MTHCNLARNCVFFVLHDKEKEMHEYFTNLYCAGNFGDCARYRATLDIGQELVPDDIFPNEDDFLSLFAWSVNRRVNPLSNRCPDRRQVSPPEKSAATSGHLPPARQTHSQR